MAKLQGEKLLKQIKKEVNKFVAPFGVKAKLGTDFCYVSDKSTVYYSFAVPDRNRETWARWCASISPEVKVDIFLSSLMHEVGHHMTMESIDPAVQRYCDDMKVKIDGWAEDEDNTISGEELDFMYYGLPDEIAATEWGLNYISCAHKVCKKFWNKIQPLIVEFYSVNGIGIEQPDIIEAENSDYEDILGIIKEEVEDEEVCGCE